MKAFTLEQKAQVSSTEVLFEENLLFKEASARSLARIAKRCALITDETVKGLWAEKYAAFLRQMGLQVELLSIPSGEQEKTRKNKELLEDQMLARGLGRDCAVIGMGGGVVTDLAGFVAATYCRGVPLVLIPTTLLAMVDASLGGKTAVDTPFGKNLIGAFYPPTHIYLDPNVLHTLSEEEWKCGAAEMLKTALIRSRPLFDTLAQGPKKEILLSCLYESCLLKKEVVERDFQETGLRRTLNFGHTIGHAIEKIEAYTLSHGEAVATGLLTESFLSYRLGGLQKGEFERIAAVLKAYRFSLKISPRVTKQKMLESMTLDKKAKGGVPRFVILEGIGKVKAFDGEYCTSVDASLLSEVLEKMLGNTHEPI